MAALAGLWPKQTLHGWLKRLLPGWREVRRGSGRDSEQRMRIVVLPTLEACREAYAEHLGQAVHWDCVQANLDAPIDPGRTWTHAPLPGAAVAAVSPDDA
jgi:hypothetical protein